MLVNLFTSFQLAEATNIQATRYYAAMFNNRKEMEHRAIVQMKLRQKLFSQSF